jgi:hypothetical protein
LADASLLGTLVRRVLKKPFELEELFEAVNDVLAMNGGHELPAVPTDEGGC